MGGSGSGRYYYGSAGDNGRDLAERQRRISITYLKQQNLLRPGYLFTLSWSRNGEPTGSLQYLCYREKLILVYRFRWNGGEWQDVKQEVKLTTTPCTYGGERLWFVCPGPGCGRRVGVLYGAGKHFLCRHCYGLAYRSQREGMLDRLLTRAQEIRQRLGGDGNIFDFYPEKPKGMHWKTYARLREEGELLERAQWCMLGERMKLWNPETGLLSPEPPQKGRKGRKKGARKAQGEAEMSR